MALRVTLNELVEMVREEAKLSTVSSRGLDHRDTIVRKIRRTYEMLCDDFEWEHLKLKVGDAESRKEMSAGQRYYDFPTALNVQKIKRAWVKWGEADWQPMAYGVGFPEYSDVDSDDSANRADPVERWRFYGHSQFEVHPIPASSYDATAGSGQVAFEGMRTPEQLTSNSSRADMDSLLISLSVAAELLAPKHADEAKLLLVQYDTRMNSVRGGLSDKGRYTVGLGRVPAEGGRRWPTYPTYIRPQG